MNLSDTDKEFRQQLEAAKPDAQLQVILSLNLPQSLPDKPTRRPSREELIAEYELRKTASKPIEDQLRANGLSHASVLTNLGVALNAGTPEQIKRALQIEQVIGAAHDAEMVLIQGQQDDKGHASRVTEERKDRGPPQVGG